MKYKFFLTTSIITIASACINGIDNPHFYRATNIFLEPRLEHDNLTTFTATLAGGNTTHGRSATNTIVPLFDIYGRQLIQELNTNTPYTNPNDPFDQLLNRLKNLPTRQDFATVSIGGLFNILESNLSFTQNFPKGLFIFFHIPIRRLKIKNITITDLSPDDSMIPNKNSPEWQAVFKNLNPLLAHYCLDICPTTSTGLGDLTSWLGWTHNYQETQTLDFIDITFMAGLLSPTGKQRNENKLFSLPTGYNGHWGFPLCSMISIGYYEWITIGGCLNTLFFVNKNRAMRLKTDTAQNGIVKLASGNVTNHKGPLINTGIYFKADHIGHGVSITVAYSFASQQKSHLLLDNPTKFNSKIINSDSMLAGWNMHTFNFVAEYDFTKEDAKIGNRIGLFYNLQIAGARTFNTNVTGGTYGIDISWYI